ncbi:MAG: FMN-binding protein, partial [Desulfuromonadaceae bacterium]
MKDISRLVIALTLIAAGAGLVLSLVEGATREPIKEQRRLQMVKALKAVLPEFDNQVDADFVALVSGKNTKGEEVETTFYRGRKEGQLTGIAFKVIAPDGFSGNIEVMVGITPEQQVQAIEILSHAETPG